jgi:Leucine-rich repeat (LRR) protein
MRLDDNDLYEEEKKIDVVNSVPGATQAYDHWGTLLREFIQKDTLDLKSKNLNDISPKLFAYKNLTVLDLSNNPALCVIPDDIDKLVGLKTLRWSGNNV